MPKPAKSPVPAGYHTITPHLTCKDASRAIEFYKKAFNAEERTRMPGPDGRSIIHAELTIGDSVLQLSDEGSAGPDGMRSPAAMGGSPITLQIYRANVDGLWQQAIAAGAKVAMPLADMFWGDRYGQITDPEGYRWALGEHKQDVTPEEVRQAQEAFFAQAGGRKP